MKLRPGTVRDAIVVHLRAVGEDGASLQDIHSGVSELVGTGVPKSSVRSYLNLNTPEMFERLARGRYRLTVEVSP